MRQTNKGRKLSRVRGTQGMGGGYLTQENLAKTDCSIFSEVRENLTSQVTFEKRP